MLDTYQMVPLLGSCSSRQLIIIITFPFSSQSSSNGMCVCIILTDAGLAHIATCIWQGIIYRAIIILWLYFYTIHAHL